MVRVDFNSGDVFAENEKVGKVFLTHMKNGYVVLNKININPEYRGKGYAMESMEQLIDYANKNNNILTLTPSSDFGANKIQLTNWYKSLGFILNKGKNKDFETMELMYKLPENMDESFGNGIVNRKFFNINENNGQFNVKEFENLRSFAARKRYAEQTLQKIGSGSGRHVYSIDSTKALKLAANPKGVAQNEVEIAMGMHDYYAKGSVTEVFEADEENSLWLIAEKAKKLTPSRFFELTGVKIQELQQWLNHMYASNNPREFGGQVPRNVSPERNAELWENEFAARTIDLMNNYDLPAGDLGRISSYGEVIRDGQPDVVLTDYGLTGNVYSSHYDKTYENDDINELRDTNMGDELDNFIVGRELYDGGYGGFALMPQSVGEDFIYEAKIESDIGWFDFDERLAPQQDDLFISHLEVFDKGQGNFKELFADIEEFARTHGKKSIVLEPDITQGREYTEFLNNLYGKYGFVPYESDPSLLIKTLHEGLKDNLITTNNMEVPVGNVFTFGTNLNEFEDYTKIPEKLLNKAISYVENLDKLRGSFGANINDIFKYYLINVQNYEKGLEKATDDIKYYDNLMKMQSYVESLRRNPTIREDLDYSFVSDASPESNEYVMEDQTIVKKHELSNVMDTITGMFGIVSPHSLTNNKENNENSEVFKQFLDNINFDYTIGIGEWDDNTNTHEQSFIIKKPDRLEKCQFIRLLKKISDKFSQEAFIVGENEKAFLISNDGTIEELGSLGFTDDEFVGFDFNGNVDEYNINEVGFNKSIDENIQQMEKNFVKTGLFDENDKNRVLDITGGDNYTYLVSKMYAWVFQIGEYKRNKVYSEEEKQSNWEKYHKNEVYKIYQEFVLYNKNVIPIENFNTTDGGSLHPIEIFEAFDGRRRALSVLKKIPKVFLRNIKEDIRKPRNYDNLYYNLPNITDKINSHLKLIERLSEEKQNIIFKKVFSSKNNTLELVLKHLDNTNINYLSHDDVIDELRNKVAYEADTDEAKILSDNGNVVVVDVKSSDAMKELGCGSQWCFATEYGSEDWINYADNSHVNIIYNFNEDADSPLRMVVVLSEGAVYNMYNEYMSGNDNDNMDGQEGWDYLDSIGVSDYINVMDKILQNADEQNINEAGISRLWSHMENDYFAILTANRNELTSQENKQANDNLSNELQSKKAGFVPLIGHWEEMTNTPQGNVKVKEQSFFVPKPETMEGEVFKQWIISLGKDLNQDAVLIGEPEGDKIMASLYYMNGNIERKGRPNLGNINKAYSQLRKKPDVTFIFESNLNESMRALSYDDYKRVSEKEIIGFINLIEEFLLKKDKKIYFSGQDIDDAFYLFNSIRFNYYKYEYNNSWKNKDNLSRGISLITNLLKQNGLIKEERIKTWMPKMTTPVIKKSCRLGGKKDGTSEPCSQGDAGAVSYKPIRDGHSHKPNTVNVAEEEKWFENKINKIIKESIINRKEKDEIFDYKSVQNDAWGEPIKKAQKFYKVNFDLENNDSTKQKKTIFVKKNLRKDQPVKYEINAELWEAGGDWEYPVMYFKVELTSEYSLKLSNEERKKLKEPLFPWDVGDTYGGRKHVIIPPVEAGNKLTKYNDNAKDKYQWAAWQDESIAEKNVTEKDISITDADRKQAWKWLEDLIEKAVNDRHEMLDESKNIGNIINEVVEGVGDKFLQNKGIMPDKEQEFNRKYSAGHEEEFVIKNTVTDWGIVKNPKRPSNFEDGVRGIVDKYGNLYLETEPVGYTHTDILDILVEEGLLRKTDLWWRQEPREFLTVHRNGYGNEIKIGESNTLFGYNKENNYKHAVRDDIDLPSMEEVDMAFKTFLKRAKLKNPHWEFPMEKINESTLLKNIIKDTIGSVLKEEKVEYGCLMAYFDMPMWNNVLSKIKDEDLYDDGSGTFGKEDEPHITILYGFHPQITADSFKEVIEGIKEPIEVELLGITIFDTNPDFDVVKIDITPTQQLLKLRKEVETFPATLTYKDYHPHMTLGYLLKKKGNKYVHKFKKPIKINCSKIIFSNKNKNQFILKKW